LDASGGAPLTYPIRNHPTAEGCNGVSMKTTAPLAQSDRFPFATRAAQMDPVQRDRFARMILYRQHTGEPMDLPQKSEGA
jgi:hypothetical protein